MKAHIEYPSGFDPGGGPCASIALHILSKFQVPCVGLALRSDDYYPCFLGFQGSKGVAAYLGFPFPVVPLAAALSVQKKPVNAGNAISVMAVDLLR